MSDIKKSISKHWDENTCDYKKAPNFDELDKLMDKQYTFTEKLLKMDTMTGKDILEIGVGSACSPCKIIRKYNPKSYTLYDISSETLKIASSHLKEHCGDFPFKTIEGDMEDMSMIPDNSFDFVVAIGSIHHTNTPLDAIKEISRILRKDGDFVFMFYNRDSFRVKYAIPLTLKYGVSNYLSIDEVTRKWDGDTNPIGISIKKSEIRTGLRHAGLTITSMETREGSGCFDNIPLPNFIKTYLKNRYGASIYVSGIKRVTPTPLTVKIISRLVKKLGVR